MFCGSFMIRSLSLVLETFSKIETFGQYPLQVNGYRNLIECLEGAMIEREIEPLPCDQPLPSDQSVKYGQERWFTKLPPVLTFELSRFEFNQSLGQPEKIHSKLEFPQIVYMDRYLYRNRELIQTKRAEIRKLKDQITVLQQKLESYMKYGSGPNRFPLPDMLQYVLEFASTKPPMAAPSPPDSQLTPVQSQVECHVSETPPDSSERVVTQQLSFPTDSEKLVNKPAQSSSSPVDTLGHPTPRIVSEEEVKLVRTCLQRWRNETEQDMQDLKDCITTINQSIEQMYGDARLCQVPYCLHAVLFHEGQANAGHYWAYICDQPRKNWLRYNDISVTESSWEELERESYGGLKNVSAYCLMYINKKLPYFMAEGSDAGTGEFQKEVEALPLELQHYVQEDNWRLEQEVAEWEEEQSHKMAQMEQSTSDSPEFSLGSGQEQPSLCERDVRTLSSVHAGMAKEQTAQAIANLAGAYEKKGVEAALSEAFHEEYSRLYLLAKETPTPHNDPRLQHVLIYLLQNNAPKAVVERTLLEQFADKNLSYDERSISIMKVAQAKLKEISPDDVNMEDYKKWHEDYSLFRKVSVYLLTGLELYQNRKYYEALTYLVYAYQSNMTLLVKGPNRGVDESLIALYRRKCLLRSNDKAATLFESGEEARVAEGVSLLNELIIPCMHLIINSDICKEDLDAVEVMRSRWCSYLGKDMNANVQLKLGELLPRLLDCSAEVIVLKEPPKIRPKSPYDLCSRFAAVMESIHGVSAVTVK
uniref:Ubiquitin specific peptidase 28 n=1 Tax=Sphenodon punctatus TaxID=8508 RepID=A0A8D0GY14_SPHPU